MTSGSMGTNHGDRYGARRPARRWLTAWVVLAAVFWLPMPAAGQLRWPGDAARRSPDNGSFDSLAGPAGTDPAEPGMIGPSGTCTARWLDHAETLLGESAESWDQKPATSSLAPRSEVSDWILPGDAAPGGDVGYLFGPRGGQLATGPRYVGPIRRWLHRFFGDRLAASGGDYGPERPLLGRQWRFCPFSFSAFMGGVSGSPLIDDWVEQGSGYLGGYRLGWDWNCYWGCEMRLGFGWLDLTDSQRAIAAQEQADPDLGLSADDPRDSDLALWDLSLLCYPWGDGTWRPYLMAGIGVAWIDFVDRLSVLRSESVFEVPLGAGVKYRWCEWLALRFDVTDNIAFGRQFDTVHDLSFTGGLEIRFGGPRIAYWPWNPGRHYW